MKEQVRANGRTLETDFFWTSVLTDVNILHFVRLNAVDGQTKIETYHPTIVWFRNFFRSFCTRETDYIVTTSNLHLWATVETACQKSRLKWKTDGLKFYRVLYVTIGCSVHTYVTQSEVESIEA